MSAGMGRKARWASCAALVAMTLALIAGLPDRAEAAACKAAGNQTSLLTKAQESRALLCEINRKRKRRGVPPVRRSAVLSVAALAHSVTMIAKGCFAHRCGGEPDLGARLKRAGFPGCNCAWRAAENIAYGSGANSTPRAVVRAWMKSRPHRKAMLKRRFKWIGIGIVPGTPGKPLALSGSTFTIDLGWSGRPV